MDTRQRQLNPMEPAFSGGALPSVHVREAGPASSGVGSVFLPPRLMQLDWVNQVANLDDWLGSDFWQVMP